MLVAVFDTPSGNGPSRACLRACVRPPPVAHVVRDPWCPFPFTGGDVFDMVRGTRVDVASWPAGLTRTDAVTALYKITAPEAAAFGIDSAVVSRIATRDV